MCADTRDGRSVRLLDPTNGRAVPLTSPSRWEPRPVPCGFEMTARFGAELQRGGKTRATFYDLSASAWAIVLPDGRFTGSVVAPSLLAFYSAGGALLSPAEIAKLRDPVAVRTALHELRTSCPAP